MRISILGCGWLGFPLAERFVSEDYRVHGSTVTKDKIALLEPSGIIPFWITLKPEATGDDMQAFLNSETLIVNIPPGRSRDDVYAFHTAQIRNLIEHIEKSPVNFVVFVSSTSVYPKTNKVVTENDAGNPESDSGKALLEVEQMLMNNTHFDATIVRFGGLFGPERPSGRFLAGRKEVPNGSVPVNLVHRDDCIEILVEIIKQDVRNEIFNACCDDHPLRKDFYPEAAAKLGLEPPVFRYEEQSVPASKIISSEKLKKQLGYTFKHSLL
ncbi:MAG: SDR family oxidoreductase [Balneolales bacterium]